MPRKAQGAAGSRARCDCGSYVTAGCKKCGRKPTADHDETVATIKRWAERRRVIGHLNSEQKLLVEDLLVEVFGVTP